ncbi:MAG: radical SAM protein [Oscillospiraceae bacterium]|nr:radical SAM protein [Oscillospiraceae bacterium]
MINRVEFIITWACTGRCKHCSSHPTESADSAGPPVGAHENKREHIEYARLAGLLTRVKSEHPVESVMCFGGEPLLHPDEVCAIFEEAKAAGIPKRQLITSGYFTRDASKIAAIADKLGECATDILLSVDAFHQETIPLEPVQAFAERAKHVTLHPAWLVSADNENEWNLRTREVLACFPGLPVGDGNVVFPRGNALQYFREYFPEELPLRSPYDQEPGQATCVCVNPNGDVWAMGTIGNAYRDDVLEILASLQGTREAPYTNHSRR